MSRRLEVSDMTLIKVVLKFAYLLILWQEPCAVIPKLTICIFGQWNPFCWFFL
jgi:hypothetical protein